MGETSIEWTHRPGTVGRTWNPTQGCSRKSTGCEHCYAERMAARFAEHGWSKGLINLRTGKWNGTVRLAVHKLLEPLSWRQPSTVFVNSMSDLFHEALTNEEIAAVFGVMAACPQHTFLILTKRADRMRAWFEWVAQRPTGLITIPRSPRLVCRVEADKLVNPDVTGRPLGTESQPRQWPLPNVWLGVSVEHQDAADERIPELLRTPAAVRFLSCEPLLGPVDLHAIQIPGERAGLKFSALQRHHDDRYGESDTTIDWVIAGCESGPGARPCSVAWLRALRNQCAEASSPVAFFLKQATRSGSEAVGGPLITLGAGSHAKGGKASDVIAAPYLDGRQHLAFPETPACVAAA